MAQSFPQGYVGTPFPDGPNNTIVTLGRHNKWGFLSAVGPDGKEHDLGLMETFWVEETNGATYDEVANSNWLELNIGTPKWAGAASRGQVRGASMREILHKLYPDLTVMNIQLMPFIWKYHFNYQPPTAKKSFESSLWAFHRIVITRLRENFISAPNARQRDDFDFIGAGFEFNQSGKSLYKSDPIVWAGNTANTSGVKSVAAGIGT